MGGIQLRKTFSDISFWSGLYGENEGRYATFPPHSLTNRFCSYSSLISIEMMGTTWTRLRFGTNKLWHHFHLLVCVFFLLSGTTSDNFSFIWYHIQYTRSTVQKLSVFFKSVLYFSIFDEYIYMKIYRAPIFAFAFPTHFHRSRQESRVGDTSSTFVSWRDILETISLLWAWKRM